MKCCWMEDEWNNRIPIKLYERKKKKTTEHKDEKKEPHDNIKKSSRQEQNVWDRKCVKAFRCCYEIGTESERWENDWNAFAHFPTKTKKKAFGEVQKKFLSPFYSFAEKGKIRSCVMFSCWILFFFFLSHEKTWLSYEMAKAFVEC